MYRYSLLLVSSLGIIACSPTNEVTFNPRVGDEHTYWTYSDVNIFNGYPPQPHTSTLRQKFKVIDTSPLKLVVTSDYADIDTSSNHFSSLGTNSPNKKAMQLLSKGFELTVDSNSGKLRSFHALDDKLWQYFIKKGDKEAIAQITRQTFTPMVLKNIPATVGAVVNLPDLAGYSVNAIVKEVDKDSVTTVIEGRDGQGNINTYGVLELERDGGWLKRLILIINDQVEDNGRKQSARVRIAIFSGNQPINLDYQDIWNIEDNWMPTFNMSTHASSVKAAKGQDLLPYDYGQFKLTLSGVKLTIPIKDQPTQLPGTLKLRNIKAFDDDRQPLNINFQWLANSISNNNKAIETHALPIGWNKQAELGRINSVTATIDYYPIQTIAKKVSWKVGEQQVDINGAKIYIKPVPDQEKTYKVTKTSTEDTQWRKLKSGFKGEYKRQKIKDNDFLSTGEKQIINKYSDLKIPHHYVFRLNKIPTDVSFYARETAKEPTYSRKITFIRSEAYKKNIE